jgi:hypothetical protein
MGQISLWLMMIMMWIYWEITQILQRKTQTLIDASKEVGLQVSAEQKPDVNIHSYVAQLEYFVTKVTNQNLIEEEMKRMLNSGNACYNSVQNLTCSCQLFTNVNITL